MTKLGDTPAPAAEPRALRADAARNRAAVLAAAAQVFRERGVEASVGEIAAAAGVGRGTLFRNFPTKQDLIVAVVVQKFWDGIERGRALLAADGDEELLYPFMREMVEGQQADRALFEVIGEEDFLSHEEVGRAHHALVALLDDLIAHDVTCGYVRPGLGGLDVLMLIKGVCTVAKSLGSSAPASVDRHLSLMAAAIAAPGRDCPLSGSVPTLEDLRPASAA